MNRLNPSHFCADGHEQDSGEWSLAERKLFQQIRQSWPELNEWGDLPLGIAWSSYSQDVYLVSWLDEDLCDDLDRSTLLPFISYIHRKDEGWNAGRVAKLEELEMYAQEKELFEPKH